MEADAYEVLNAKLSFSEARDKVLLWEVEEAEKLTQPVRDDLVRNVVTLLQRDELAAEMLAVEQEVEYRSAVHTKELEMREEKQLADELRAQMMASGDEGGDEEEDEDEEDEDEEDEDEEDEDAEDDDEDKEEDEEEYDEDDNRNWTTVEHQMREAAEYSENLDTLSALVREWRKSHDSGTD
jgi:Mg-chelatase subunit ChlI